MNTSLMYRTAFLKDYVDDLSHEGPSIGQSLLKHMTTIMFILMGVIVVTELAFPNNDVRTVALLGGSITSMLVWYTLYQEDKQWHSNRVSYLYSLADNLYIIARTTQADVVTITSTVNEITGDRSVVRYLCPFSSTSVSHIVTGIITELETFDTNLLDECNLLNDFLDNINKGK